MSQPFSMCPILGPNMCETWACRPSRGVRLELLEQLITIPIYKTGVTR